MNVVVVAVVVREEGMFNEVKRRRGDFNEARKKDP